MDRDSVSQPRTFEFRVGGRERERDKYWIPWAPSGSFRSESGISFGVIK